MMKSKTNLAVLTIMLATAGTGYYLNTIPRSPIKLHVDFDSILVTYQTHPTDSSLAPLVGFLHSYPDTALWDKFVSPLKPIFWRNKTFYPNFYDKARDVNPDLHYQIVLSDFYPSNHKPKDHPDWPFNNYSKWTEFRREKMELIPENVSNISIDIWNEPNLEQGQYWQGTQESFFELFCETASWLNIHYPQYMIAGPSATGKDAQQYIERMIKYMEDWKRKHPEAPLKVDMLAIHGIQPSFEKLLTDLQYYSNKIYVEEAYKSLKIKNLIYNEYLTKKESNHFSYSLRMLEVFEKHSVKYAARACWGTCKNGSLDGLLSEKENDNYLANEVWFGYAQYANIDGKRYNVKKDGADLAVIAGENKESKSKIILVGNPKNREVKVELYFTSNTHSSKWFTYVISHSGLVKQSESSTSVLNLFLEAEQTLLISNVKN